MSLLFTLKTLALEMVNGFSGEHAVTLAEPSRSRQVVEYLRGARDVQVGGALACSWQFRKLSTRIKSNPHGQKGDTLSVATKSQITVAAFGFTDESHFMPKQPEDFEPTEADIDMIIEDATGV